MNNNDIYFSTNKILIEQFIDEVIVGPMRTMHKWAGITRQTPAFKIGYVGQHLASLITGVKGSATGARGTDLLDGTEVKTCNKVDQVGRCKSCNERVMAIEDTCWNCGSNQIERKNDSKWLFSVRSEDELKEYCKLDRLLLLLFDYPGFERNNLKDIRISAFEIYPNKPQGEVFSSLLTNHYWNIYLKKIKENKKANPMNLHPFGIQFFKCHPVQTFSCIIKNVDTKPETIIEQHVTSQNVRRKSLDMPSCRLNIKEWQALYEKKHITFNDINKITLKELQCRVPVIPSEWLDDIELRDVVPVTQTKTYKRK